MLDALMLLSAVAAFGYIVVWVIRNDNAASIRAQRGLLRMLPHEDTDAATDEAEKTFPARRHGRGAGRQPRRGRGRNVEWSARK